MKCPECVAAGQRSRIWEGLSTRTCMSWTPWYDEDGAYHNDDPNTTTTSYRCTNGHRWVERR